MKPYMNRAEMSALHVAMLAAMQLPHSYSEDSDTYQRQVWCEVIALADPERVLALADKIHAKLPSAYVEIDPQSLNDLRVREGELETNLALRTLGFRCRERGHMQTFWTNAPIGSNGQKLALEL